MDGILGLRRVTVLFVGAIAAWLTIAGSVALASPGGGANVNTAVAHGSDCVPAEPGVELCWDLHSVTSTVVIPNGSASAVVHSRLTGTRTLLSTGETLSEFDSSFVDHVVLRHGSVQVVTTVRRENGSCDTSQVLTYAGGEVRVERVDVDCS